MHAIDSLSLIYPILAILLTKMKLFASVNQRVTLSVNNFLSSLLNFYHCDRLYDGK